LAEHFAWELQQERDMKEQAKRRAREFRADVAARNAETVRYREALAALADEEDGRLLRERTQVMELEDARRAADAKRMRERVEARQRLIDAETRRQMQEKTTQQDFLERQLEQQHEKERSEIEAIIERRQRLADERRAEFILSRQLGDTKRRRKVEFPLEAPGPQEQAAERRLREKAQIARDAQEFQRQQVREKKERERAEVERDRLEFNHRVQQEQEFLRRAQQYARDLLAKAHEDEDNSDLSYYTQY
jgi:hypothetical protein